MYGCVPSCKCQCNQIACGCHERQRVFRPKRRTKRPAAKITNYKKETQP